MVAGKRRRWGRRPGFAGRDVLEVTDGKGAAIEFGVSESTLDQCMLEVERDAGAARWSGGGEDLDERLGAFAQEGARPDDDGIRAEFAADTGEDAGGVVTDVALRFQRSPR
jgi:hypothetical protein